MGSIALIENFNPSFTCTWTWTHSIFHSIFLVLIIVLHKVTSLISLIFDIPRSRMHIINFLKNSFIFAHRRCTCLSFFGDRFIVSLLFALLDNLIDGCIHIFSVYFMMIVNSLLIADSDIIHIKDKLQEILNLALNDRINFLFLHFLHKFSHNTMKIVPNILVHFILHFLFVILIVLLVMILFY